MHWNILLAEADFRYKEKINKMSPLSKKNENHSREIQQSWYIGI